MRRHRYWKEECRVPTVIYSLNYRGKAKIQFNRNRYRVNIPVYSQYFPDIKNTKRKTEKRGHRSMRKIDNIFHQRTTEIDNRRWIFGVKVVYGYTEENMKIARILTKTII